LPSLTIIELLRQKGADVSYNDPFFPSVGHGCHYDLNMTCTSLDRIEHFDAVVIVTDHSSYDYQDIVNRSQLVIDTRNATEGIKSRKIIHCYYSVPAKDQAGAAAGARACSGVAVVFNGAGPASARGDEHGTAIGVKLHETFLIS